MQGAFLLPKRGCDRGKTFDRQAEEKIIADYAELGSYRAVARKRRISDGTVKRICERDPETTQNIAQKKNENTADILAFMDGKKEAVCDIIWSRLQVKKNLDFSLYFFIFSC